MMIRAFTALLLVFSIFHFAFSQVKYEQQYIDRITVHFESGKAILSDSDKIEILEFVEDLDVVMPFVFYVQAHTDSIGTLSFNQKLSERRTNVVAKYLLEIGIPEKLISTKSLGELKPLAENLDEEGRALNRRCNIFVFKIQKQRLFKSKVNLESGQSIRSKVYVYYDDKTDSMETDKHGNFSFVVPEGKDISFGVFAPKHMFHTQKINTNKDLPLGDITLPMIRKGQRLILQNLYFVGDKTDLLPESKPELLSLIRFLDMNKKMKIEIGGHVNGPKSNGGDQKWYDQLALHRTYAIRDYLNAYGVDLSMISCKSYSNSRMIYPEPVNEEEAKMNRRVEIKILEY